VLAEIEMQLAMLLRPLPLRLPLRVLPRRLRS